MSELPSNSNDFFKQKLTEASEKCEKAKENEAISGSGIGDDQSKTSEVKEKELKIELEKANKGIKELKIELEKANKELKESKKKVSVQKEDIKLLKHSLNASNRLCVSKDIKIERLIKENQLARKSKVPAVIFDKFEGKINASTLKNLRSVPAGQPFDSTFILKLIRHLYENDHNVLLNRSAAGKNKEALTPTKKNIIQEIFRERVVTEEEEEARIVLRTARVGMLICDAIRNIVRPLKKVEINNVNANTNTSTSTNTHTIAGPPPLAPISKKRKLN